MWNCWDYKKVFGSQKLCIEGNRGPGQKLSVVPLNGEVLLGNPEIGVYALIMVFKTHEGNF